MPLVNDRCICIRKVEYSETSQILHLFSRGRGLLRVIAKGAHRVTKAGSSKFGGGIDLLDLGDATFSERLEKDLQTLTEWKLLEGHLDLRRSLRAIHLGTYAAELVNSLTHEHDPHPRLFDVLERVAMELGTPRLEQEFIAFALDLLREAGFMPDLSRCASCGRPAAPAQSFALERSGVLCRNCEMNFPTRITVPPGIINILQTLLRSIAPGGPRRLPMLTRHQADPINRLLAEHIQHTLGKELRTVRYVLA